MHDYGKESERALIKRGDDPYPNDIKAEAILVYESGNFAEGARRMEERYPERPFSYLELGPRAGLEPATYGLGNRCSIH